MKCKHNNGYAIIDTICIDYPHDTFNNDFECLFICNNRGCNHIIKLKFDIRNIEEVKE